MQPTPQNNQLMSKHGVLKPQRRLEWRGQDGQNETEQPDHSASLGDSITSSTRIRFSVHTPTRKRNGPSVADAGAEGWSFLCADRGDRHSKIIRCGGNRSALNPKNP